MLIKYAPRLTAAAFDLSVFVNWSQKNWTHFMASNYGNAVICNPQLDGTETRERLSMNFS